MTTEISTYRKYANLQMAAESLFAVPKGALPGTAGVQMTVGTLTLGNERSSRFTATQAQQFLDEGWQLVEHTSNTSTGFSGTLFRNSQTGELVLSFRSTEFADDAARDNQATNVLEISKEGFAFGQIADMEKWFSELKTSGKLDPGASLTVTGYSLGGHLATAFNLLHRNDLTAFGAPLIAATYTFNGAGVGTIEPGATFAQVMADFTGHRALGSNVDLFVDADVRARYDRLKDIFKEGANVTLAQVDEEMRALALPGLTMKLGDLILYKTLDRIRSVVYEVERVIAGVPSGTAGAPASQVKVTDIAATGLDYQLAVRRAAEKTAAYRTDVISGGIDALAGRNIAPGGAIANFYDLYAASPPSAVANSQYHYGTPTAISIEDQPLFRGTVIANVGTTSVKAGEAKLLVDNFGLEAARNDFLASTGARIRTSAERRRCASRTAIKSIAACAYSTGAGGQKRSQRRSRRHAFSELKTSGKLDPGVFLHGDRLQPGRPSGDSVQPVASATTSRLAPRLTSHLHLQWRWRWYDRRCHTLA